MLHNLSPLGSKMKLTVKVLKGDEASLEFESDAVLVAEVKKAIAGKLNIPVESQSLIYKGKALADSNPLSFYSIPDGSKLIVSVKPSPQAPPSEGAATPASTASSSAAEPGAPAGEPYKDWSGLFAKLERVLTNHFSKDDVERINQYIREELRRCVYSTNLDQIEYIAKQSIQIHEDKQVQLREEYYKRFEDSGTTQQQPTS